MDRYLFESFVCEFKDMEMIEKSMILFANMAQNKVEKRGNKKITFNYYPQEEYNLQLVIEAQRRKDAMCITNMKIHHTSPDIWQLKIINSFADFADTYMASRLDESGFVIVRLVNEQVLGKIKEGDVIEAQIVGMAVAIEICKDEKEYEKIVPKGKDGKKNFLGDGALISANAIINNLANLNEEERNKKNHIYDDLVDFKGTIKKCYKRSLNIYDIDVNDYYMVEIDTEFGPLHIVIPQVLIPKRVKKIEVGNVIVGKMLLSADVCIKDYEKYMTDLTDKSK